jgi:hypothetical protein
MFLLFLSKSVTWYQPDMDVIANLIFGVEYKGLTQLQYNTSLYI